MEISLEIVSFKSSKTEDIRVALGIKHDPVELANDIRKQEGGCKISELYKTSEFLNDRQVSVRDGTFQVFSVVINKVHYMLNSDVFSLNGLQKYKIYHFDIFYPSENVGGYLASITLMDETSNAHVLGIAEFIEKTCKTMEVKEPLETGAASSNDFTLKEVKQVLSTILDSPEVDEALQEFREHKRKLGTEIEPIADPYKKDFSKIIVDLGNEEVVGWFRSQGIANFICTTGDHAHFPIAYDFGSQYYISLNRINNLIDKGYLYISYKQFLNEFVNNIDKAIISSEISKKNTIGRAVSPTSLTPF